MGVLRGVLRQAASCGGPLSLGLGAELGDQ